MRLDWNVWIALVIVEEVMYIHAQYFSFCIDVPVVMCASIYGLKCSTFGSLRGFTFLLLLCDFDMYRKRSGSCSASVVLHFLLFHVNLVGYCECK